MKLMPTWLSQSLVSINANEVATATRSVDSSTQYVQVGNDRIAYRSTGQGRPLLLANRLRGTLDTWDPLFLDELARQHRVVTFDFPGIGYSDGTLPDDMSQVAAFIDALADALRLAQFALLGWSWGGLAAQAYLLDYPQRPSHVVLLATNPPGPVEVPLQPEFLQRATKPVNDLADEEVLFFEPASSLSRQRARQSHDRIYARPGVVDRIPASAELLQRYFTAAQGYHADHEGRRGRLAQVNIPLLVIAGDHDISTAGQNWFPLIGQLRDAEFVFYSQTGHAPQHQHPERVAAHVAAFLARPHA
ncbi:alpha/beta fold hydrolase [Pseudoxanthomonas dokdonensis]|uniref:alpha/beta fold hydrolase n=1 Tax=Pseudoxanthomonas dokdonensis TaxID=344882 RepID=UPI0009FA7291|nr:alpha/beta hydrolase [Pseudoxanthomonas dokdonensis]